VICHIMEKYRRHPNTTCSICGGAIYRRPSQRGKMGSYCSQKCYGIACRKVIPCVICGNKILSGLNKKTCSDQCLKQLMSRVMSESRNSHPELTPIHNLRGIRAIRRRLIGLNKNCKMCKCADERVLVVHHVNKNRQDNRIENLDLLCANCHAIVHYKDREKRRSKK
jgi:hypothetical protein